MFSQEDYKLQDVSVEELLKGYGKVDLYIEGKISTLEEVTATCKVCESYSYMADYIVDENGYLREIHYDRVRNP